MFRLISLTNEKPVWAVFGKHPLCKDFINTGEVTPLLDSFSLWMDKGISLLNKRNENMPHFFCYFFAKGPNNELICGTINHSSDSIGREYPLLMICSLRSGNLFKNWHLIPYSCRDTWSQLKKYQVKK